MKQIECAKKILESARGKTLSQDEREKRAVELAACLLEEALRIQTKEERATQQELARMMSDPNGKAFTMTMTDQCFRSHKPSRVADQLVYLLRTLGVPRYLTFPKRVSLQLFRWFGKPLAPLLVPAVKWTLRRTTNKVILPGEKRLLSQHMSRRRKEGVRLNLNHLGEAILGEQEAIRRLNVYLRDLEREDVEYVSIKISTIFSQINILDWEKTEEILSERLRQLYRTAMHHSFKRIDGSRVPKFVNLDMEEYKDLLLTKELFKKVLEEEEFFNFSAGIVLQAYLPDSFAIQQELTTWARQRKARGGAPIKIRLVKGANLAMEQVEASLFHWEQTPYKTKHEVDANFKRMVTFGCQPEHAEAVQIGVGSHNLFDIAFALLLREEHEVQELVTFEMLEGMADHIRRVVQQLSGSILLYCPVATREDFQSAIAYLIRRLDENTGAENFLRHSFGLRPGTQDWTEQVALFSKACKEVKTVSASPRRKQNRFEPPHHLSLDSPYRGEIETDLALPQNQRWVHQLIEEWQRKTFPPIPLVIGGKEMHQATPSGKGTDPSHPEQPLYFYSQASWEQVDEAISAAKKAETKWATLSAQQRASLLSSVARKMREKRASLIGVMMRDGGKTYAESEPEVAEAIDFAEYYLRSLLHLDAIEEIAFSPKGTVLVTPPWNFPISIPAGGVLAALAAGNCVLFKPAPEAVLSGWILVNLFWEAGISKEVLQFINCPDEPVGSRLISDQRIDTVILTGGTSTARLFMKLRPDLDLAAETGGKNAMIITALSDRDLAIKNLVQSAFGHSGQKCSAASLAILEKEVYEDEHFLKQLKDAVESLHVGTCWELSSKVIPLIKPPTGALLKGLTTLDPGEKWLVKPKPHPTNPHLWSPGVKLGVKPGSFMHQTELFGPVLGVMCAKNVQEAIRFANGTPYGLTSGIQSLDPREIELWLQTIQAGNCYVNRGITGAIVERQPFGGCKSSSFGRGFKAGGPHYVSQFMHKKEKMLPKERGTSSEKVASLTAQAIKLGKEQIWNASIQSYAFWAKEFSKDQDPQKLMGEDNLLRHRPHLKSAIRIEAEDDRFDALRTIAAAWSSGARPHISIDPRCKLSVPSSTVEESHAFKKRLERGDFERVRLLAHPSSDLQLVAASVGCYLNSEPVLSSGRFELLHYLREISISVDYHRYGNLGLREGEPRSDIL